MSEEKYFVRVQLIKSDKEGEYISKSFDYEVSPTTSPYQDILYLRAERFYKKLQTVLGAVIEEKGGSGHVTDRGSK